MFLAGQSIIYRKPEAVEFLNGLQSFTFKNVTVRRFLFLFYDYVLVLI